MGSTQRPGAYFDWVMANAILDDQGDGMICQETGTPCGEGTTGCNGNDPCIPDLNYENSIRKVDRTTVKDIGEIASAYSEIQSTLDKADAGLNPLGLASNVVPFGLNPTAIQQGQTHFDQIYQRAVSALSNAVTAFNYANENTRRLRNLQDRVDTFDDLVEERELDYEARLIEIFGKPYPEDIGGTGAYPVGYNGPDLYHYDYADPSELIGTQGSGNTTTFTITFQEQTVDPVSGVITVSPRTVNFVVSTDGLGLVKPEGWTERTEPGEIQFSRSELLQGIGRYQQSVDRYESLIDQIEIQADLLESLYELNRNVLQVMREGQALQQSLNQQILVSRLLQARFRTIGANALRIANAIAEGLPTSLIGGLANGGDFTGPIRASVRRAASFIEFAFNQTADALSVVEQQRQFDKEWASAEQQIQITGYQGDYQVEQQVAALRNLVRQLPSSRLEIYTLGESVNQATGRYHAAIGRGLRLLDQRAAYRRRTADEVSEFRYQDMAYRVFRNESLQKYRAQFDLAAEYVYLAARAYDYETNLLGTHALAGRQYLTNIVKQRTLGVMAQSGPQIGSGLAGTLAEMFINFDLVLRPQLGFNSAAELNRTFSLRWELFRKPNTNAFNSDWQQVLEDARVSDINDFVEVPEYRMFCKPLNADPDLPAVANPGIVLRFSTKIFSGLNFFGHASQADEVYPSSYDTIKLHSIGIRFENYPLGTLNNQAEVYLVPAGMDVLREPTNGEIRNWQLLDQTLPVPFPLGEQSLAAADWMPWDSLSGGSRAMVKRRLIPQVTGLPAQGHEDDEDLRYHLTGRSVWNTQWVLIIPASELRGAPHPNGDPLDLFIYGTR
ncbi:MAG: hypothetical protein IPK83_20915 [Planctomycetes bacterium]|nr:hypothetical protein [Planctomycetota bacterium]